MICENWINGEGIKVKSKQQAKIKKKQSLEPKNETTEIKILWNVLITSYKKENDS